jgi:predicted nucleic acid-binding protein
MIFVDSGAWFSLFVADDPDYEAATNWFAANDEALVCTDFIIDETLTLLRARNQPKKALEAGTRFFAGQLAAIHYLSPDEIGAAWDVFRRFADKAWSFTDCTSKVIIEKLGIKTAFSFDHHFRQFGSVSVEPSAV